MTPEDLATAATAWAKLPEADDHMRSAAQAVAAFVARLPVAYGLTAWPADVELGAVMLTARLYRRRNSPAGIEALTDMGATYVSRYDSDVSRLLRIDAYAGPVAV
ncbi:MAG: hypothetical protein SOW43_07295 [Schaalia hyovaginalis]|nr:hypothetical protein [Schaalia hyovaginalis]MCI6557331.1 hypothetical protein [Schaalia hyovaginalis]MDY3094206.1 hypothetical protein [Schaalia hyovaginalis]